VVPGVLRDAAGGSRPGAVLAAGGLARHDGYRLVVDAVSFGIGVQQREADRAAIAIPHDVTRGGARLLDPGGDRKNSGPMDRVDGESRVIIHPIEAQGLADLSIHPGWTIHERAGIV